MLQKVLKATQVAIYINTCKSQVYKLVKQGRFPKPIKLGDRGSGWLLSEVDAWLQSRVDSRDEEVANDKGY
ncbi:AlpA family phage regulatory protein [Candidatus Thioglobus sp.]|mgnify:FL=1|jgi:prophage regulatory protein|nr:AlpA family phage regulatory protein [Candidatus Thioglobus sp.]|tara:strand:+ start:185 stop:397 length:213 start_codon:yes stop_codon:yes gene_type:complete